MKNNIIKTEIDVKGSKISITRINDIDYISLTDLARYADNEEPRLPIRDWMRNKEVISYLGLWESINNINFKGGEFDTFKNEAGSNKFKMSPQKWIRETNAIGIISKSGRYDGGTFAHPDIAFEFASWLSPEFKLYLIQEFQRLKKDESYQEKIEWHANRILSKINYVVHTDAIKKYIIPTLTEKQIKYVYAEEADVLNVALFGMTAKEWKSKNPKLAKNGNIRDYTDLLHLIILNNLENINAELISSNIQQSDRLIRLNQSDKNQMEALKNNKNIKELELLQNQINNNYLLNKKSTFDY
ncbi:MAG: KilA-N domain-containing protein [Bacilli bacterium]|nr:KilA-N domain-containing protein [Bacilli bacterium]